MNVQPDIEQDCLLVDGTETVQLHATSVVTVAGAKRGALSLPETEFRQVGLESSDLAWNLPAANLGDVQPQRGQTIEDGDGVCWTILSARLAPLTGVWRAITRRQH